MEPLWYLFPAGRQQVEYRFNKAVLAAETFGSVRAVGVSAVDQLEPIASSVRECLRFPAISAILPQLAAVLTANEEANRARGVALSVLKPRTDPAL